MRVTWTPWICSFRAVPEKERAHDMNLVAAGCEARRHHEQTSFDPARVGLGFDGGDGAPPAQY